MPLLPLPPAPCPKSLKINYLSSFLILVMFKIPDAPKSITKGLPLKLILDKEAAEYLADNIHLVYPSLDKKQFINRILENIEPLGIKDRAEHFADTMQEFLPDKFTDALAILMETLTEPLVKTEDNGLAVLFYMPHCAFIEKYGLDPKFNQNEDPFHNAIQAQYELTQRFSCEFSIRPFIKAFPDKTMEILYSWMEDKNPHVRRLCSEGTRPRLPWASKIDQFVKDPSPSLPILEKLKDDSDLYVRRSVANHVGDIAKDHLDLALDLCEKWAANANSELKWLIRHAVRNPVKKGNERAIEIRKMAK
jgi:3-methyladenine DNA glycosylase AlkC